MTLRARTAVARLAVVALAAGLGGCGLWRPTRVPVPTLEPAVACAAAADTLLVLLPGAYSAPRDFIDEGFVQALRARGVAARITLVDAHLGYYADRSVIERLQADVIEPARARGVRHIWLVGISVGAFGAMINAEARPAGIDGVVALSPYLGARGLQNEIAAAGGLRRWKAPDGPLSPDDIDTVLWRWLQRQAADRDASGPPPLYLGYGSDDRFLAADQLLAAALPAGRVFTQPGGHDWPTWLPLWQRLLDVLPLSHDPACSAGPAAESPG